MRCLTELELARAVGSHVDHLDDCTSCRDERDRYEDVIELARQVPLNLPSSSRREEVRTAVLSAALGSREMARLALPPARPRRVSRTRVAIAGVVAAAAAAVLVILLPAGEPAAAEHVHATISARPGARFTAISTAPDEVVRLEAGTIDVDVAPLHAGERFRVIVGDAEVEVRGTSFEVTAEADRLVSVDVRHGRVEVRPRDRAHTLLGAGEGWRARPIAPPRAPEALPPVEPPPAPAPAPGPRRTKRIETALPSPAHELPTPSPAPPAPARAPEELAYDDAWAAMRAQDYARAATSFARVLILAPDGGLAEDAAFWQAVALARGGRRGQAVTAFRDFLDAHPRSPHAGEASAMLGWLLLDAGERAEAARRFRAAVDDPNKAVRDSARSGLDALVD